MRRLADAYAYNCGLRFPTLTKYFVVPYISVCPQVRYPLTHLALSNTAYSTIAETCLSYLNSQQIRAPLTSPSPNLRRTPFLQYSSLFGVHAKQNLLDRAKLLALRLFDNRGYHFPLKSYQKGTRTTRTLLVPTNLGVFSSPSVHPFLGLLRPAVVRWRRKAVKSKKTIWIPVVHLSPGLLVMGTKKWWKLYSNGTTLTPINRATAARQLIATIPTRSHGQLQNSTNLIPAEGRRPQAIFHKACPEALKSEGFHGVATKADWAYYSLVLRGVSAVMDTWGPRFLEGKGMCYGVHGNSPTPKRKPA